MPIFLVTGPSPDGLAMLGDALHNNQISQARGGLLIDATCDRSLLPAMLDKLLDSQPLPKEPPADWKNALPWKRDCSIIIVGDQSDIIGELEKKLPGFVGRFGPIWAVTLRIAG